MQFDPNDQILWDWATRQDQYTVDQFGIGIVGMGALFFAYGQVSTPALKLLIALIGFGGSLTLWMHMYGAREEYYSIKDQLKARNTDLFERLNDAMKWREKGIVNRFLYHPASRLMTYFMALVSWAWLAIILYRLSTPFVVPLPLTSTFKAVYYLIWYLSWLFLILVIAVALIRKYYTDRRRWR